MTFNFMYLITIIVCLSSLFAVSCSSQSGNKNATSSNLQPTPGKPATPSQPKVNIQLSPENISRSIYEVVLSKFVPIDGTILMGSRTIGYDVKPDESKTISAELWKDFEERNRVPADIVGGFDVYANIEMVKVTGEVREFLTGAKKKSPKAVGLVLVSKVGMTETPKERLVYVEFHEFDGQRKSFLLISRYDPTENRFNSEWIELKS